LVLRVLLVRREHRVLPARRVHKVMRAHKARKAQSAHRGLPDLRELQEHKEVLVPKVPLEHRVQLGLKDP
jgi:hypothetical protein